VRRGEIGLLQRSTGNDFVLRFGVRTLVLKCYLLFHDDGTEAASGEGGVILGAPPNLQTGSVNSDSFGAWANWIGVLSPTRMKRCFQTSAAI
jgi:hypothetical protein